MNKKVVILIPALDPPALFEGYVAELIEAGFTDIIVVNDGSHDDAIFNRIADLGAVVLTHAQNEGKGQGLKTGFEYYQKHFDHKKYAGVITADSDGQHLCKDVKKLAEKLCEGDQKLILGSRDFSLDFVPEKSRFGNNLTSWIFRNLLRIKIGDTQTGLRGIPNSLIQPCLDIPGKRFEYETDMLIRFGKRPGIIEVPIETVYLDENKGTHFNPIVDSFKIYRIIFGTFFRYLFASAASWMIDYGLFLLFDKLIFRSSAKRILIATCLARVCSSIFNFTVNKKLVFKSNEKTFVAALKYFSLCVVQMMASVVLVTGAYQLLHIDEGILKPIVDTILFFVSYQIQQNLIFSHRGVGNER